MKTYYEMQIIKKDGKIEKINEAVEISDEEYKEFEKFKNQKKDKKEEKIEKDNEKEDKKIEKEDKKIEKEDKKIEKEDKKIEKDDEKAEGSISNDANIIDVTGGFDYEVLRSKLDEIENSMDSFNKFLNTDYDFLIHTIKEHFSKLLKACNSKDNAAAQTILTELNIRKNALQKIIFNMQPKKYEEKYKDLEKALKVVSQYRIM